MRGFIALARGVLDHPIVLARYAAHDAPRVHPFAATSAPAGSLTADLVEGLPSGEVPVGVVVYGPSNFRKLAIEWVHALVRCRIVLRGAA